MHQNKIAASILSANFAKLGEEVADVIKAGADLIHFDVMDNHYVPNLTVGPLVCQALRNDGLKAPIDVHLMVKPVDQLIIEFAKAGASYITIHPESTEHIDRSLQLIRDHGCQAGLAFNPATSLDHAQYVLDKIDLMLIMSVNPGFGGQKFLSNTFKKIRQARRLIEHSHLDILLEVDGGIKIDNIAEVAEAGADTFVLGSGIFHTQNYTHTLAELRAKLAKGYH